MSALSHDLSIFLHHLSEAIWGIEISAMSRDRALFLADVAIRVTVVLALTAILSLLARRAAASCRHLVWALGLGCSLLLPAMTLALPGWTVAVTTPVALPAPSAFQPAEAPVGSPDVPAVKMTAAGPGGSIPPLSPAPTRLTAAPLSTQSAGHEPVSFPRLPWPVWAILVWATGAAIVLARLASGLAETTSIEDQSAPVTDGPLAEALAVVTRRMQVTQRVILRQAHAPGTLRMPLTYGALSPVIVLPAAASEWPRERLRAVLLHELAHVRRQDWLLQIVSQIACALYWFHPLMRLAARRLRAESEAACDDMVLAAGVPATEYARHLLEVALSARDAQRLGSSAIAMAQGPKVEGRLRRVLAAGLSRAAVRRKAFLCALTTALLFVVPVAILRLVANPLITHPWGPGKPTGVHAIPGGGTMELVSISYFDFNAWPGQPWWGPDGLPLAHAPVSDEAEPDLYVQRDRQQRALIFKVRGVASDVYLGVDIVAGSHFASAGYRMRDGRLIGAGDGRYVLVDLGLGTADSRCTVRVGIAPRVWTTVASERGAALVAGTSFYPDYRGIGLGRAPMATLDPPSNTLRTDRHGGSIGALPSTENVIAGTPTVAFSRPEVVGDAVGFTVCEVQRNPTPPASRLSDDATRIVAIDRRGRTIVSHETPASFMPGKTATIQLWTAWFPGMRPADIKELRFQTHAYHWVVFNDIPLQPPSAAPDAFPPARDASEFAAAHITRGREDQLNGLPDEGLSEFRRAVELDPANADAQCELAMALQGITFAHHGITVHDIPIPPALRDEAILHMQKAASLRPKDASLHRHLGRYLAARGRYPGAIAEYRQAIQLQPTPTSPIKPDSAETAANTTYWWCDSQSLLGDALVKMGLDAEAVHHYRQALQYRPDDVNGLARLADCLDVSGRSAEAKAAWQAEEAIDPAGMYLDQEDWARRERYRLSTDDQKGTGRAKNSANQRSAKIVSMTP